MGQLPHMSRAIDDLLNLSECLSRHLGITHWAVSMRIAGKGDFLQRLRKGGDCSTGTYEKVMGRLMAEWPPDAPWPEGVGRPPRLGPGPRRAGPRRTVSQPPQG
jgi:hypothetical protein